MIDLEQAVMNSHTAFWQGYAERDLDKRFSVCADDVTFFGTGVHERAVGKKQYREMNEAGLRQSPLPFGINVLWYHLRIFGDVAWVECDTEWVQGIGGLQTNDLIRQTTIFKLEDGKWLVKHVHGSEPDYRLKAGEYMVNEEIAKRNPDNKKVIGIVAALTYEKQPFVCLGAMKLLHQKNNNFICIWNTDYILQQRKIL